MSIWWLWWKTRASPKSVEFILWRPRMPVLNFTKINNGSDTFVLLTFLSIPKDTLTRANPIYCFLCSHGGQCGSTRLSSQLRWRGKRHTPAQPGVHWRLATGAGRQVISSGHFWVWRAFMIYGQSTKDPREVINWLLLQHTAVPDTFTISKKRMHRH